jgi:hypothetical protein
MIGRRSGKGIVFERWEKQSGVVKREVVAGGRSPHIALDL